VDEYLTEKEQIEQIKQWWKENGWYLLLGVAIVAFGYLGINQYRAWQNRTAEEAAAAYEELRAVLEDDDRAAADSALGRLAEDFPKSPYLDQARLLIAEDNLIRDRSRSIAELQAVVDETEDDGMKNIARLRLARVLAYDEQFDRALEVLDVPDSGEFGPRFSEVRGDIQAARGNPEAAISAYTDALFGAGNGTVNSQLIQLKLDDLAQAATPGAEASE
jgi:predicted negative regulator of RcsB-dependent stress response